MTKKNRTIPQFGLKSLTGDSAVFCVDRTTLDCILTLWRVTLYNSTFTLYGKEITELSIEELSQWHSMRAAILDDFERGMGMGCDITATLNRIASAIEMLNSATVAANRISVSCCGGGGNGGNNNSGVGDTDPISPPETPQESTSLCTGVRFVQHVAQSWVERYLAPLAGLNAEQITLAVLASFALPPYGDELPAIAVGVVAAMVGVGVAGFVLWLGDLIPAIADELYCRLTASDYPDEGVAGWLADVIADVIASEAGAGAGVADWIVQKVFNVSGATAKLIDLCVNKLDVVGSFADEPCTCEVFGAARLLESGLEHTCGLDLSAVCPEVSTTWCSVRLGDATGTTRWGLTCTYDRYRLSDQPADATSVAIRIPWVCYADGGIVLEQSNSVVASMATGYSNYDCDYEISATITAGVPVDLFVHSYRGFGSDAMAYTIQSVVWS